MCNPDSGQTGEYPQLDWSICSRCVLSVVEGGRLRSVPRALAVDTTALNGSELAALKRAEHVGLRIVPIDGMRAEDRMAQLAHYCVRSSIALREVAVIAIDACDCDSMLEVGTAFALESAGYDACIAADRVFAPRSRGGLVEAIDAVCDLAR